MTSYDFERNLVDWLDEAGAPHTPDYVDELLERARRTRQRPAWASLERWLPMQITAARRATPFPGMAWLLALALLLMIIVVAALIGASTPHLPPPIGPAGNGLIAFDEGGRISTIDADGSDRRFLTPETEVDVLPAWSPDGTHLAFYSFPVIAAGGACAVDEQPVCDSPDRPVGSVVVMRADGTGRRTLATKEQMSSSGTWPVAWSHDGTRIAHYHMLESGPMIEILPIDGSQPSDFRGGLTPAWSPDDRHLAYGVTADGVYVVPVDGSRPARKVSHVSGSGYAFDAPQWSPDGRRIAFYSGDDGDHDIYTVAADGSDEHAVSLLVADEYWPMWSPDGTRLAFQRASIDGDNGELFVIASADGTAQRQLETDPIAAGTIGWSPDGRYLVGVTIKPDLSGADHIILVDVDAPARSRTIPSTANVAWQRVAP